MIKLKSAIEVMTIQEYHKWVDQNYPNQLQMRFRNLSTGEDRKYGYVANYYQFHYWHKTKKQAEAALLQDLNPMYPVE